MSRYGLSRERLLHLGFVEGCTCRLDMYDRARPLRVVAMGCPVHDVQQSEKPRPGKFPDVSHPTVAEFDSFEDPLPPGRTEGGAGDVTPLAPPAPKSAERLPVWTGGVMMEPPPVGRRLWTWKKMLTPSGARVVVLNGGGVTIALNLMSLRALAEETGEACHAFVTEWSAA